MRERGFRFRQCDTLKSVEDVAIGGLDIPRDGLASIVRGRHNTTEAIVPFLPSYKWLSSSSAFQIASKSTEEERRI